MTRPAASTPTRSTARPTRPRTPSASSTRSRPLGAAALLGVVALAACTGDPGSTATLCASLRQGEGYATVFADFDPTDAEAALEQLRPARVELGDLKDAAPGEVADDLQVEIDYVQALIDALAALPAEPDAARVATTVQSVTDAHPGVTGAAATLQAFATEEC